MKHTFKLMITGLLLVVTGCASTLQSGGKGGGCLAGAKVLLAPVVNATDDDHAGAAVTELAGTVLMNRGASVVRADVSSDSTPVGTEALYQQARDKKAQFVVEGTVHEYRYKTDLDGDPAVGITLRLVEASSGKVLWQGSSSEVGVGLSSLTSAAQDAVTKVIGKMDAASSHPTRRR